MWIGTRGDGLGKLDRKPKKFRTYTYHPDRAQSLSHPLVRAIRTDRRGNVYVGSGGGGLDFLDRAAGSITRYRHDPADPNSLIDDNVTALEWDQSRTLWIGTRAGLSRLENGSFTHFVHDPTNPDSLVDNRITTLFAGKRELWIGTQGGISRYNGKFDNFRYDPGNNNGLSQNHVTALVEDDLGILWIGTDTQGLDRYDGSRFTRFAGNPNDRRSLSNNSVRSLHQFLDFLWVGTHGGGLNRFSRETQQFKRYQTSDGLPSNVINGILDNGRDHLWISTSKGLSRFQPYSEEFRNYSVLDGLQGNQFSPNAAYRSLDGELFFGGVDGMSSFFPRLVKDNPHLPNTVITHVEIPTMGPERDFSNQERILLSHRDTVIRLEFAAMDFTLPEKNLYQFILEGFDADWSKADNLSTTTYTSLPPGEYTFKVRGSNNDGVWSEEPARIELLVSPPFYQSTAAYIIYGLLLFPAGFGLVQLMRQRERAKANIRIQAASEKIKAESNRAKQTFLANMSHELRTPITAIIGYAELIEEELEELPDRAEVRQFTKDLSKIKSSAYQQLTLVANLLELSKLEAGQAELHLSEFDVLVLVDEVQSQLSSQFEEQRNEFRLQVPDKIGHIYADRTKVLDILLNVLSFSNRNMKEGTVTLTVRRKTAVSEDSRREKEWCHLIVRDTGPGLSREELSVLFKAFKETYARGRGLSANLGLALSQRFCEMMGGIISVESERGRGNVILIKVPVEVIPALITREREG